ncbi:hypothetical protein C6496_13280 [Candidatus Poribacteria bacterium]|nr:hypothetical protein [Candidatus Poribacteria bacterium]RKU36606.1 MAG: hypothetical protein C6496_13280 [Candidatus Poribacteria bacterium]
MQYRQRGKQKRPNPIGTAQGRHTLISLLGCAILGMVLSRVLPPLIGKLRPGMTPAEAEDTGVLIALVISGIVLVISLLRPRKQSVSPLRKQLMKEQEKSDGR